MKKQFDIQYRPQIESGKYKVITNDGHNVRIICWDKRTGGEDCIVALVSGEQGGEKTLHYTKEGYCTSSTDEFRKRDLFIVTPEEELSEFEIRLLDWLSDDTSGEIPMERMKEVVRNRAAELLSLARGQFIKDGYVIEKKIFHDAVEKVSPEVMKEVSENIDNEITQLTEFERAFDQFAEAYHSDSNPDDVACCKEYATKLLSIAEKELSAKYRFSSDLNGFAYGKGYEDGKKEAEEDMKEALRTEYEKGRAEALKDLPRWNDSRWIYEDGWLQDGFLYYRNHSILLKDLEKLPGFKED